MSTLTRLFRRQAAVKAKDLAPLAAPCVPTKIEFVTGDAGSVPKAYAAFDEARRLPPTGPEVETPAYYEVWGGMESANRALWAGLWFSTTTAILSLILVRVVVTRPPVVIRVSDSGASQVMLDSGRQPPVGEAEVKNFLGLFERFFWGLNFYGHEADLKLAFSMMTQNCQKKADELLKREGTVETLKANQSKTVVTLTDLEIQKDTPELLECRVLGNRQTTSYKPEGPSGEVVFEHNIVLRKVPRSDLAPYGLLVEDFTEKVYKK